MSAALPRASRTRIVLFASLFFLTTSLRAMLISVIPLQALDLLGDAHGVSVLYLVAGSFGIVATVLVPRLVRRLGAHGVFALGSGLALVFPFLLSLPSVGTFLAGMLVQVVGVACVELTVNLYVMRRVPRRELGFFEPVRVVFSGSAFIVGPWAGVYLQQLAHWAPFATTAAVGAAAYAYSLVLGLHAAPDLRERLPDPHKPLRNIELFLAQPRLLLAWSIAFARNGWWTIFFVYSPIYCVGSGLSEVAAGAVVSAGSLAMYLVPLWGWVGRRFGLRRLLTWGFAGTGVVTPLVVLAAGSPGLGAGLMIAGAVVASSLDGGGHIAFYRAVRPLQRAEMTGVYLTYRDVSQLLPPAVFSVLLSVFSLSSIYVVGAAWMLGVASLCRHIPRRL